jgi:hypothetical protein
MTKEFHVTRDDIASGQRNDGCECPVALSIRRALNISADDISVTTENVSINLGHGRPLVEINFPFTVTDFIREFDNSEFDNSDIAPEPFTFWIDLPAELIGREA